jgi:hypothetical protein
MSAVGRVWHGCMIASITSSIFRVVVNWRLKRTKHGDWWTGSTECSRPLYRTYVSIIRAYHFCRIDNASTRLLTFKCKCLIESLTSLAQTQWAKKRPLQVPETRRAKRHMRALPDTGGGPRFGRWKRQGWGKRIDVPSAHSMISSKRPDGP